MFLINSTEKNHQYKITRQCFNRQSNSYTLLQKTWLCKEKIESFDIEPLLKQRIYIRYDRRRSM